MPVFAKPVIISEATLVERLWPYLRGYHWALDTIGDLWRMGAPVPNPQPDGIERRIILPGQFKRWWEDVCQRQGVGLAPDEVFHA